MGWDVGTLTSMEVQEVLKKLNREAEFPLFTTINRIIIGELPPTHILKYKTEAAAIRTEIKAANNNH